jgi:hypothetical protein
LTKYGSHIFAAAKARNADTLTKQSQAETAITEIAAPMTQAFQAA